VTLRQAQCGDAQRSTERSRRSLVEVQSNEGRREKIEGLRFQYLARVKSCLGDCYTSYFATKFLRCLWEKIGIPAPSSIGGVF
jgi:hypothetical protein